MSSVTSFASLARDTARTRYYVYASDVSKIICHRSYRGTVQYLVRWTTGAEPAVPPRAICSWHSLEELSKSLHHVQTYIEDFRDRGADLASTDTDGLVKHINRKRKSPGSEPLSRDWSAPPPFSTANSYFSVSSSSSVTSENTDQEREVYNGVLQRKAGRIIARRSRMPDISRVNAARLPTNEMSQAAALVPIPRAAEVWIRQAFLDKLRSVKRVGLENHVDTTTPSLDFTFINSYILREGVFRADPETYEGCQECKPNMGQNIGCEYPRKCSCLEFAAVNEDTLRKENPSLYLQYKEVIERGEIPDTKALPKRFPYRKADQDNRVPRTLLPFYRESRHAIYECNLKCRCGPICKSRLVQNGRTIPLTIFKTPDRGWGVKCDENLVAGEFIDTYLGEIITNSEADRRETRAGKDKASYLYSLDKFIDDDDTLTSETCHVVDGQYMGGPTRFINHSCEPNCRQFTVSYNKHDLWVYDLAFFAIEDIEAGTELTFDYMDKDEEEEEDVLRKRQAALEDPENEDKRPCNCGARKCRGYLWV